MGQAHARARAVTVSLALFVGALFTSATNVSAQSTTNLTVLGGLAPFGALLVTERGKAALASNYTVTSDIQTGKSKQPSLESFSLQQAQALKDAFITSGNAGQLADGLGTKLDAAYRASASYASSDDGASSTFTSISANVADVIAYTAAVTSADAASAKFFFANATVVAKSTSSPVSKEAADLLAAVGGTTDVLGKAYGHPAGSIGADPFGDSRPFQTEANVVRYSGTDFFGIAATNFDYLTGPTQNLTASPSFPSGHTTYGYTEALLLAIMVPARYPQMIARGAEYGNSRIVLGAHYVMDVIGGRTIALYDVAHLLAEHPDYVGRTPGHVAIAGYQTALHSAQADLIKILGSACGAAIAACAAEDTSRFRDTAADAAFYESTQTYGLPVVFESTARRLEDVAALAPEAGYLLTAAFPALSLAQADAILTATEGPGGGFLDDGSAFGLYSRLDLFAAGRRAAAVSPTSPSPN